MNGRNRTNRRSAVVTVGLALLGTSVAVGAGLWNNPFSIIGGMSNGIVAEGVRRSLLDDFEVTGEGWVITTWRTKYAWQHGPELFGVDAELTIYPDIAGAPDFESPVATAENRTFHEAVDPNHPPFFGLTVVDQTLEFDPIELEPGRYWVEMLILGPEPAPGVQLKATYPQRIAQSVWVDYDDFGGRRPGVEVFGDHYDVNFMFDGACNGDACVVLPVDLAVTRGTLDGDFNVEPLWASDDEYLVLRWRPAESPLAPVARLLLRGYAPEVVASEMTIVLETAATSLPNPAPQRIALFDYDAGMFETVDERASTLIDQTIIIDITSNASRFIDPETKRMTIRVEYFNPIHVIRPSWTIRIDRARWDVVM